MTRRGRRRRTRGPVALAVALGLLVTGAATGCGGGADDASRGATTRPAPAAAEAAPDPGADVRWSRALDGPVVPGPVLARGGLLLAASGGGTLFGLDARTGAVRWRLATGASYGSDLSTSPLVRGDLVVWPGSEDTLRGLDLDGRARWSHAFASQPLTPARGRGDRVYVEEMGGRLHALDVDGAGARERWSVAVGAGVSYGSPAVGPDGTIYTTVGRSLVAVRDRGDRATVAWRFTIAKDVEVSPAVLPDGTIVLGTNDGHEYGLTPAGKVRWRVARPAWSYSSPGTRGDRAAFGDHRGVVQTVDERGRVVGTARGIGQVWTRPAIGADGSVFFGTHSGYVQGFSASGRELLRLRTGGSVESYPVLGDDGTLYVGSEDGRLYAIDTPAPGGS